MILLDINMPEMDGFEVMRRIREKEESSKIPIIFLTADVDPDTVNRCMEEGAVDYVAKPFVIRVLRSRVDRTLELQMLRDMLS